MAYDYVPPQSTVFGFVVFLFVTGLVGLTITKDSVFRKSWVYQNFTSACLAFTVYIFPAIICIRVAFAEGLPGPSIPRKLLFAESGTGLGLLVITFICWLVKTVDPLTRKEGLCDINELKCWDTYNQAVRQGWRIDPHPQKSQKKKHVRVFVRASIGQVELPRVELLPHNDPQSVHEDPESGHKDSKSAKPSKFLANKPILWGLTMAYFFFRFLLI